MPEDRKAAIGPAAARPSTPRETNATIPIPRRDIAVTLPAHYPAMTTLRPPQDRWHPQKEVLVRVPDLDWPADLYSDVPVSAHTAAAEPAFWATMLAPPMQAGHARGSECRQMNRMDELVAV